MFAVSGDPVQNENYNHLQSMKKITCLLLLSTSLLLCSPVEKSYTGETFTDNSTGLEWMRCAIGLSGNSCQTGTITASTWEEAITGCENITAGGHSDWRLPSIRELTSSSIYYYSSSPQLDKDVFPNSSLDNNQYYWTSTSVADAPEWAWVLKPWLGEIQYRQKTTTGFIRCVRGPE